MTGLFAFSNNGMSAELIFWAIHLIVPALIYISFLYIIYTTDSFNKYINKKSIKK